MRYSCGYASMLLMLLLSTILYTALAWALTCPYTGAPLPTPYSRVTILPVDKYVGREMTISITDVDKDKTESAARDRLVIVYYILGDEVKSEFDIYTDRSGNATFTPGDSGDYAVATSGRYIFFAVESLCNDGYCSSDEDRSSCPGDCARCGDGVCDVNEDKKSCPKDCVVCGDGDCDIGENRNDCPGDCARCGDGVCDVNENKKSCPEDCVVCGDGVCDPAELVALHETSCPEDCVVCGDGICDATENGSSCPGDCRAEANESPADWSGNQSGNSSLNATSAVGGNHGLINVSPACGDGVCDATENGSSCPGDCARCGDDICEDYEVTGFHKTSCPEDCAVCGDGYCDIGESKGCPADCSSSGGALLGYLIIPIAIIIVLTAIGVGRGGKPASGGVGEGKKPKGPNSHGLRESLPSMVLLVLSLAISTLLPLAMDLGYDTSLAIFDIGTTLLSGSVALSLIAISLATAMAILSNAVQRLDERRSMEFALAAGVIGMLPGLAVFHNLEFLFLFFGMLAGMALGVNSVKTKEQEIKKKKAMRLGAEMAGRTLKTASLLLCLGVLLSLYTSADTGDNLGSAIWKGGATRGVVESIKGHMASEGQVMREVVDPLFESKTGGLDGKMWLSLAVAGILFVVLGIFIAVTRLLAGFLAWLFDRSGLV